jgi:Zn ribbon nucleic-acid-binding protein
MKKTFWWGIGTLAIVIILIVIISSRGSSQYDNFAKCTADLGTKMYGAYWCPHCQAQKKLFGNSWDLVNYVECATPGSNQQTEACNVAGIKSYPTWVFPDGKQISGELSLEQLSVFTGCPLTPAQE